MQNPYEVLGIKEGASEEEIKAAYREQVKKYHPDRHQDNPLYELAEEKLQEINEAYDYLMKNQSGGSGAYGNGNTSYSSGGTYTQSPPEFMEVRRTIDRGDLASAEQMLNRSKVRNGEWFFLNSMVHLKKGWYNEAVTDLQTAISMEPNNMEYRRAMNSIMAQTGNYQTNAYGRGYNSQEQQLCQCLQCYCCADMLCDCI